MLPILLNQSALLTCIVQPREGGYIDLLPGSKKKLVLGFGEGTYSLPRLTHAVTIPASPSEPLSSIFLRSGLKHYCGSRALRLLGSNHWQGSQQTTFDVCSLPRRRIPDLIHFRSEVSLFSSATLARAGSTAFCFLRWFHLYFICCISSSSLLTSSLRLITHSTWHVPREQSRGCIFISFHCRCAKGYKNRNYFCNQRSSLRLSVISI